MISKEVLKAAIDRVPDEYLEILYRILKAFDIPVTKKTLNDSSTAQQAQATVDLDWQQFIKETYGSLSDAPIQRGDQGKFELREAME